MKQLRIPVIATHITGWLLFQSLPLVFLLGIRDGSWLNITSHYEYWLFCLYYLTVFYVHTYWLLPHFFYTKRWLLYIAGILVLVASLFWISPFEKLMASARKINMTENHM